jgi:hypothetical protein
MISIFISIRHVKAHISTTSKRKYDNDDRAYLTDMMVLLLQMDDFFDFYFKLSDQLKKLTSQRLPSCLFVIMNILFIMSIFIFSFSGEIHEFNSRQQNDMIYS